MGVSFGHKKNIVVIIPTRELNEVTKNNLYIINRVFIKYNIIFEIIIVSNCHEDCLFEGVNIYYDNNLNAAISRNLGLSKCKISEGVFIFLDDDIIIDFYKFSNLVSYIIQNNNSEILAPYLSGFFLKEDYKFSKGISWFYSWLSTKKIANYHDLQGKTFYSYNFSPLYVDNENFVEWATGGFLIFNKFNKDQIQFDTNIFGKFYHLEDFFLTHELFVKGIKIKLLPIVFTHVHLPSFYKKNTFKYYFNLCFKMEINRLKIQFLNITRTNETIWKFKLSLFFFYLYRLKGFSKKNFAEFLAIIYLCLFRNRKY
jgi:hypothetical protein